MAGATTTAIPYTAKAWPRLLTGKVSARMACSLGASPPPPTPCSTRKEHEQRQGLRQAAQHRQMVNSMTQVM